MFVYEKTNRPVCIGDVMKFPRDRREYEVIRLNAPGTDSIRPKGSITLQAKDSIFDQSLSPETIDCKVD